MIANTAYMNQLKAILRLATVLLFHRISNIKSVTENKTEENSLEQPLKILPKQRQCSNFARLRNEIQPIH
jgi:hypothetical protein